MKTPKPVPSAPLSTLTEAELSSGLERLLSERARRLSANPGDMTSLEASIEQEKSSLGASMMSRVLSSKSASEDGKPRSCAKCGGRAYVEEKQRARTIRTLSGEHSYRRHFYRCKGCRHGFSPIDDEMGIPADGCVTLEVERRIVDFGVHDTFEEGAQRFSLHYDFCISENMVRRVVDRVADALEEVPESVLQEH